MNSLLINIRFYVLLFSISLSLAIYFYISSIIPEGSLQIIKLTQTYALTAISYLYLALLAGPFCYTFKWFPLRAQYLKARRAIGVSAFYFGLLHGYHAFFFQLGGFEGLGFLSNKYLLAISLSFTAFLILSLMAATSFDFIIEKLTFPKWKLLHRLVYLAAIFILTHALMLGTHFQDLSNQIPQILFAAVIFLITLEGLRIDAFFQTKFPNLPKFGLTFTLLTLFIGAAILYLFIPKSSLPNLGIHSAHIQLAKDIQSGNPLNNINTPKIPGLDGDKTKRYTVDFDHPENILPNQEINLNFQVYDASSGNKTLIFKKLSGKTVHLIIVDSELNYFSHIHPEQTENGFTINTSFPKEGNYHLYLDFQPLGAIEQQIGFSINIGSVENPLLSHATADIDLIKTFGKYEVTLSYPQPLQAAQLSIGQQRLNFNIKDANTKNPISNLKPYLESFGHLVMINKETFDYLHVHPVDLTIPPPDANGGPNVEFMPIGIYAPIKPGLYRVFGQFNPDNELFTADFTVEVK